MNLLFQQVNVAKLKKVLMNLPEDRSDLYNTVMERIDTQDEVRRKIATTTLMWVTYVMKPLCSEELIHGVALELSPDSHNIDAELLIELDILLSSCMGLVIFNKDEGVIGLVHYTTQDYLKKRFIKSDANTSIAKTCLRYFELDMFSDPPVIRYELKTLMTNYRLCGYAAQYWGYHAYESQEEDINWVIFSCLCTQRKRNMIEQFEKCGQYFLLYLPSQFSLLHLVSMYGLSQTCAALLNLDSLLSNLIKITSN
jgi:hypothetical protein